jgi:hypothetical protein
VTAAPSRRGLAERLDGGEPLSAAEEATVGLLKVRSGERWVTRTRGHHDVWHRPEVPRRVQQLQQTTGTGDKRYQAFKGRTAGIRLVRDGLPPSPDRS